MASNAGDPFDPVTSLQQPSRPKERKIAPQISQLHQLQVLAFLAQPQRSRPRPRRKKSDSVRSKEFRAKRKQYEESLIAKVEALRADVENLAYMRGIRQAGKIDPCLQLVREYYNVFHNGMGGFNRYEEKEDENKSQLVQKQTDFVHATVHPDLRMGVVYGIDALIDQWQRYTAYHGRFQVEVLNIQATVIDDDPLITVTSILHLVYTRLTIIKVFPHVAHDEFLIQRLIGKQLACACRNEIRFSDDQKIVVYDAEVDFIEALVSAGVSMSDIALLLPDALIANQFIIGMANEVEENEQILRDACVMEELTEVNKTKEEQRQEEEEEEEEEEEKEEKEKKDEKDEKEEYISKVDPRLQMNYLLDTPEANPEEVINSFGTAASTSECLSVVVDSKS